MRCFAIGVNGGKDSDKTNKINSIYWPTIWFALKHGVSVLKPQIDRCTLEVVGKTGWFELAKEIRTASIQQRGEGNKRENAKRRAAVDIDENQKKREKRD